MKPIFFAAALALALGGCAMQQNTPALSGETSAATSANFETDRAAILAMAGNYKVTFDFRETVSFLAGYTPIKPKVSGGDEIVRVIEDTGRKISLQHILIADDGQGNVFIIKHWRQDWVYEPETVLTYAGPGRWTLTPVSASNRAGAWSQTVWQTDDSPRYGGVGRWDYRDGATRWTSDETWRPLARRDAVRAPPYNRYDSINRHALIPGGWIHEQDNAKIGPKDGKSATFVHEVVLNTYLRNPKFDPAKGDAYWAKTKDYWAAVREMWDTVIAAGNGVSVAEEPENGSVTGPALMGLADEIMSGTTTTPDAIAKARQLIVTATAGTTVAAAR